MFGMPKPREMYIVRLQYFRIRTETWECPIVVSKKFIRANSDQMEFRRSDVELQRNMLSTFDRREIRAMETRDAILLIRGISRVTSVSVSKHISLDYDVGLCVNEVFENTQSRQTRL